MCGSSQRARYFTLNLMTTAICSNSEFFLMVRTRTAKKSNDCQVFGKDLAGQTGNRVLLKANAEKIVPVLQYLKSNCELSEDVIFEYGRFLLMKVMLNDTEDIESIRLSPSGPVDQVWHAHMLIPQHYVSTCDSLCGHVIVHHPKTENDSNKCERDATTRESYLSIFGEEPPTQIWPPLEVTSSSTLTLYFKTMTGKLTTMTKIKSTYPMSKVFKQYANPEQLPFDDVNFLFNGQRIGYEKGETFEDHGIKNQFTIHVILTLRGC